MVTDDPGLDTTPRPRVPDAVLRATDHDRDELDRALRAAKITRVRRGVYAATAPGARDGGVAQAREREVLTAIAAAHATLRTPHWFAHESAALLWGMWHWGLRRRVDVVQLSAPHVRPDAAGAVPLRRHLVPLPVRQRAVAGGLPVTSVERTVVDCARVLPSAHALVTADSALRLGADRARIDMILRAAAGGRGVRRARRVLAWADARSQSPGESLVRHHLLVAGMPAPEPQVAVETHRGTRWVDLGYPDLRLGIEFDGAVKYADRAVRSGRQSLWEEKVRHDALVEAGWRVLRVTAADLRDAEALVARVRAALTARARAR